MNGLTLENAKRLERQLNEAGLAVLGVCRYGSGYAVDTRQGKWLDAPPKRRKPSTKPAPIKLFRRLVGVRQGRGRLVAEFEYETGGRAVLGLADLRGRIANLRREKISTAVEERALALMADELRGQARLFE